jgi:hypothetical protein
VHPFRGPPPARLRRLAPIQEDREAMQGDMLQASCSGGKDSCPDREHILFKANTFYLQREDILSVENTYQHQVACRGGNDGGADREDILYVENTFYL